MYLVRSETAFCILMYWSFLSSLHHSELVTIIVATENYPTS